MILLQIKKNGLIYIWSLGYRKVPEFTFTCTPEITSAIFHPYNPKLIVGGTHTGQVMIWDTRGKQTAVNKTPLGLGGGQSGIKTHTSDITCLGVIGSTNSSHIISLSNGALCLWSLNNFSSPVKRIELKTPIQKKENEELTEMSILSMGMQQNGWMPDYLPVQSSAYRPQWIWLSSLSQKVPVAVL